MRVLACGFALMMCAGCDISGPDENPPQLIRFQISEGPTCSGCPLPGRDVTPGSDNILTLRVGGLYALRAVVRTSGDDERCIGEVFHANWLGPERVFNCWDETSRELTIDRMLSITSLPNVSNPVVTAQVIEYENRQERIRSDVRTFSVRFVQ